jgi:hypothetical protein
MLAMFSAPRFLALYRIVVAEAHNFPDLARQLWCYCMERGYTQLAEYLKSRRIGGGLAVPFVCSGRLYRLRRAQSGFEVERSRLKAARPCMASAVRLPKEPW